MAKGAAVERGAVASVAARRRARELRAMYEARDVALVQGAEEFLTLQERTGKAVEVIDQQIERLEAARDQARREGWEQGARVAARMRGLQVRGVGVREEEVADRLGVEVGELRRMLAQVKAAGGGRGGFAAGVAGGSGSGARRAAGGGGELVGSGVGALLGGGGLVTGRPVGAGVERPGGGGGGPVVPEAARGAGVVDGVKEVR
ncbi:hypothetical protein ACIOGZ_29050 [Kitasatospora sp. NPDC088160]|uniref:hypothetical protein n=1 Tax=Kitasatospora sp. NPDC088160 TaxID=3364072 RepID=UPI0037FFD9C8